MMQVSKCVWTPKSYGHATCSRKVKAVSKVNSKIKQLNTFS